VVSFALKDASCIGGKTSPFPTGDVAPGQIVSLLGLGLGPSTPAGLQLTSAGTVATTLGGTKVLFDGVPAPLLYSANGQVNAVVPYEVASPVTQMTVESGGLSYGPIPMPVVAAVPAIFLAGDPSNPSEAAAINPDGTLNSVSNPVARGSYVTFYACGVGLMTANSDGAVTPSTPPWPAPQLQPVTVAIRGFNATVQYAGAAPGYVSGLLQINVFVPGPDQINSDLHVPLFLTIGNYTTQDNVTIAIQ